jgi:hypothetical protein
MSGRTLEEDVLQKKSSTIIKRIAVGSDLALFGSEVSGAGFASGSAVNGNLNMAGITDCDKVRRIMNAVTTHITTQSTPEVVTEKFNTFVLLLHDKLELKDLAKELTQALSMYTRIIMCTK